MYEVLLFSSELKQNDKLILQLIYNLHWRYITGQFLLNVNANFFPWILKSKVKKETLHFWKVTIPMHCINACFLKMMIWSNDDIKFSFKHIITDIQRRQICPLHCVFLLSLMKVYFVLSPNIYKGKMGNSSFEGFFLRINYFQNAYSLSKNGI